MFYIFNKDNQCISSCNAKPNVEDLATRGEFVIEDARDLDISAHEYVDGVIREKPAVEYVPTKEDKINAIKAEYEPRFKTLEEAQRRLLLMDKPTTAVSTHYIALNNEMVARIKEVK